ncbi:hypothetical protein [Bacillus cereus]|uniref:hypothetical protein n=1 Tax=Bacillus cereus TaxID=1396 RepID=UPI000942DA92|nr:hypothetical protein [Bacillus cereus]
MSEKCQYEQCHAILKDTKADVIMIDKFSDSKTNILTFLEKTSYREFKDNNAFGMSFPLPVAEGPPIMVGVDMSEENYNQMQGAIKENKVINFSNAESFKIISQIVNPSIYNKWLECMKGMMEVCKSIDTGQLTYSVERNYREIIIKLRYNPHNSTDTYPILKSIHIPDVMKCDNDCLKEGMEINREFVILFTRIKPGSGTIIIGTDKGSLVIPVIPNISEVEKGRISDSIEDYVRKAVIAERAKNKKNDLAFKVSASELYLTDTIVNITLNIESEIIVKTPSIKVRGPFGTNVIDIDEHTYHLKEVLTSEGEFDLTDSNSLANKMCFKLTKEPEIDTNMIMDGFVGGKEFCIPCLDIANEFFKVMK